MAPRMDEAEQAAESQPLLSTAAPGSGASSAPSSPTPAGAVAINIATPPSPTKAPAETAGICRICLEEDALSELEVPCNCAGTQQYAHHACIQRWVDEKGNAKCEICQSNYRGAFTVPPQPVGLPLDNLPLFILDASDPRAAAVAHRARLEMLESDAGLYSQRSASAGYCATFLIVFMVLITLHHTLVVDGGSTDYDPGAYDPTTGGGMSPGGDSGAGGTGYPDDPDFTSSFALFVLWILSKLILIGVPLYTVMRIAARQARREQIEAMLRAGAAYEASRRLAWRSRAAAAGSEPGPSTGGVAPPAPAVTVSQPSPVATAV